MTETTIDSAADNFIYLPPQNVAVHQPLAAASARL